MAPLPALVTVLALILYFGFTANVGRVRRKTGILAPQMTGEPEFERALRVQLNTLEQIVLFLPAMWLFCQFVNPTWAAIVGGLWIVGRILFAWGYYQAAEKRFAGVGLSFLSIVILMLGALVGIVQTLFAASA